LVPMSSFLTLMTSLFCEKAGDPENNIPAQTKAIAANFQTIIQLPSLKTFGTAPW